MYEDLIAAASQKWGVDQGWIGAVIQRESSGNPNAFNASDPGGSRGLMQISGPTAHAYGVVDASTLFDPATNIDVGTHLLHDLKAQYGDDFAAVYSAYNSGSGTNYLTNPQVAANVAAVMQALQDWTLAHPIGDSSIAVLIVLAFWWLKHRKK